MWTPVKIRSYEKEERLTASVKRSMSKQSLAAISVPSTPTTAGSRLSRRAPQTAPDAPRHDKGDLLEAQTPNRASRVRSHSDMAGSVADSSGGGSSSRPKVTASQQAATKNNAAVLDGHLSSRQFAFVPESKLLFSAGHWDHSLRATFVETGRLVQSVCQHSDVITCLAFARDFGDSWLATGSRDCTLMIWAVNVAASGADALPLGDHPLHILYGHDDAVTSVAVNAEIDIVVSGSEDGTVIIHNLRDGSYVRSIIDGPKGMSVPRGMLGSDFSGTQSGQSTPRLSRSSSAAPAMAQQPLGGGQQAVPQHQQRKISWLGLSKENYIVTYSADDLMLCTYTLNGFQVATHAVPESLYAFLISEDGKVLITGGSSCLVVFRWVSAPFNGL